MRVVTWTIRLVVFVLLVAFAARNADPVTLRFYFDLSFTAPLVVLLLAFFVAGALFGVLALVMPILGTGFAPSLLALALLALPPILINTCIAIREVDPDIVDAARGMGMARREIIRGVELPIAMPVIFAGIRTSAVQVVSGAVLAAYIGGGGLGDFITAGIAMMAVPQLLVGAIPATLLSIGTDQLFGRLQKSMTPKGLRA